MWGKLIFSTSSATESGLTVFLALGECADKNGLCSASMPQLSAWCKITDRQAQRCVRALIECGELEQVSKGGGRGNPPVYQILLKWRKGVYFRKPKRVTSVYPLYGL